MAQQTIVRLVDDLDGSEAVETIAFAIDGKTYEIDLNADHAKALRENLADHIAVARNGSRKGSGATFTALGKRSRTAADTEQTRAIRQWARQNGHQVSDKGRISAKVQEAFHAVH